MLISLPCPYVLHLYVSLEYVEVLLYRVEHWRILCIEDDISLHSHCSLKHLLAMMKGHIVNQKHYVSFAQLWISANAHQRLIDEVLKDH